MKVSFGSRFLGSGSFSHTRVPSPVPGARSRVGTGQGPGARTAEDRPVGA